MIEVVPTMKDNIGEDAMWCGSFQLAWKEFESKILKNDFLYNNSNKFIENLNNSENQKEMISDKDYYNAVGKANVKLKKQIKNDLKRKFKENSELLKHIDFDEDENTSKLLIYTMLKKVFTFNQKFDDLGKSEFGKTKDVVDFFGISKNSKDKEKLMEQVNVLFYNSENDYSIMLDTLENERVILYRNNEKKTFEETFLDLIKKCEDNIYNELNYEDTVKIPNIKVKLEKEYKEIEGESLIRNKDKEVFEIFQALQNIDFELDRKGGKVKSEAAIVMVETCAVFSEKLKQEPREFNFDDTFYLYLVEKEKEIPYLAMRVNDIKEYK